MFGIGEIMVGICAVVMVGIIFNRATTPITKSIEHLTDELKEMRAEAVKLMAKVIKIDSTYVTEEECAKRREDGSCPKH